MGNYISDTSMLDFDKKKITLFPGFQRTSRSGEKACPKYENK